MSSMLEGKTAFVTGGTGGIGSAICARFAREGAQVIAADLTQQGELSDQVEFAAYDVTDETICQNTFATLAERWDKLDILVNAAGIEIEKTIEDTTLEEWNRIFAINVTGMFLTSKYALPLLRKSDGASVINFGSYDGYIADPGLAAYCTRDGLRSWTRRHPRQCDLSGLCRHTDATEFFR
jgi:meso-butanediol dehydrogenase/(S,S)-butanediol dehydrogenase/diacetyl reductase